MAIATDETRAAEAIVALLALAARRGLHITRTKAVKLLYLADLHAIASTGFASSGVAWRWWHYGPYSQALRPVEDELVDAGIVDRQTRQTIYGEEFVLSAVDDAAADLAASADPFIASLDEVLKEYGDKNATALKALAYRTPPMVQAKQNGRQLELLDLGEHPDADPDGDIAAGRVTFYEDSESFIASLEA